MFSRVNAFAVNWSYSEETRGIDILIKTSRMQVFIHMFSYSVLPPCLRHCAIHSRRYAGWSRGSSRFSFLVPLSSCLPTYPRSTGHHGGKIWVEEPRGSWDSFRNSAGVVFLPAENVETGRCVREGVCGFLICECSGLLYEILILEDIPASLYSTRMQISSILDFSHFGCDAPGGLMTPFYTAVIFLFFSSAFSFFWRFLLSLTDTFFKYILEMESRWIIDISSCDYLATYIAIF